jgi:hypothetical protein
VTLIDGRIQALYPHLCAEDSPERTLKWKVRVARDQLPK